MGNGKGVVGDELSIKEGRQFTLMNRMNREERRIGRREEGDGAVDEGSREGADWGKKGKEKESESE